MNHQELIKSPEENNLAILADQLDALQTSKNDGRGISCVRSIVDYLKNGDLENAKRTATWDQDKISSYPDIKDFIRYNLFKDDEDHPWKFLEKIKKGER